MCEFCSIGPNNKQQRQHGNDSSDLRFAGFFSPEAIEAAIRQADSRKNSHNTNNNNHIDNIGVDINIDGTGSVSRSGKGGGDDDEEGGSGEADDDGT